MSLMEFDGAWLGLVIGALIIGLIAGFFITRKVIQKQMEKNPPISEAAIRAMFIQMGRKPSESQIKAVVNSMKNANK